MILTARLVNCEFLFDGVRRLWLEVPTTFHYRAGQYIYLTLANGDERPYSIANAPHDNLLEFHIHYHSTDNAFTHELFKELLDTKAIQFRGPAGQCIYPSPAPEQWILLAGGTGLAPCKAFIEEAIQHEHTKPVHLYWGARSAEHLYLDTLLKKWEREHSWFKYTPILFTNPELAGAYRHGMVHEAVLQDHPALNSLQVFASGPAPMVFAAQKALLAASLPPGHFSSDYT